jgi:hypothetical protein
MDAANAELDAQGFGPTNFSIPAYDGARAGYATLHAWSDPAFQAAVEAIDGVTVSDIDGTPRERVEACIASVSATASYGGNAPLLTGTVSPGLHRDGEGNLWWVIQGYNTGTYPDPDAIPALVRRARIPGQVTDWVQPIDQFDAYLLSDPFTGEPERVMHGGQEWVTERDLNVWEPGTSDSGWVRADGAEPVDPPSGWVDSGATTNGPSGAFTMGVSDDSPFSAGQTIRVDQNDALVTTVTGIHSTNLLLIDPHVTVGSGQMIEIEQ